MKKYLYIIPALIWWVITFFTDHLVFTALKGEGVIRDIAMLGPESRAHYTACKLLLLLLLLWLWRTISVLVSDIILAFRERKLSPPGAGAVYRTALYSLLYLIPILAVLVFKLPEGFLSNDESLIFAEASALNTYTWFYYLTTYYYITTMMLIPSWLGPVLFKVALQVIVCGLCVYRFRRYTRSRWAFLIYVPFFLFPVLAYTTSAHRIPVYYLVYLAFLVKLVMDRLEGVDSPGSSGLVWILFAAALITQWRTEGIYMAPLSVILLALAYPKLVRKKVDGAFTKGVSARRVLFLILICMLMQYAVQIPQNGLIPTRMGDKADNRMGPFWAYTITNMYRNGLDLEKNSADLEKVYRFLDRDVLRSINEDLGDINYEDTLILYYPGYTGTIPGADTEDYNAYVEGCRNIFRNNPDVFMRTRMGAFKYAALPYGVEAGAGPVKLAFSLFKSLSYNLFIPCALIVIFCVAALIRKTWIYFFICGGIMCHWFIVFILAPASYFKYYLPVYMPAYFGLFAGLALLLARKTKGN